MARFCEGRGFQAAAASGRRWWDSVPRHGSGGNIQRPARGGRGGPQANWAGEFWAKESEATNGRGLGGSPRWPCVQWQHPRGARGFRRAGGLRPPAPRTSKVGGTFHRCSRHSRAATGDRSRSAWVAASPPCTTTLETPRAPRGVCPERGCVRGAPAAAGWPQGTPLIPRGAGGGDSGPLRLVRGGHSRAPFPWVAAPPLCVHRVAVVLAAVAIAVTVQPERGLQAAEMPAHSERPKLPDHFPTPPFW